MKRLLCLIPIMPGLALAQGQVRLIFQAEAPRVIWVAKSTGDPPPALPEVSTREVVLPKVPADSVVCVLEKGSGNMAAKLTKSIDSGTWKLTPQDFRLIGRLEVRLDLGGEAAPYASVVVGPQTKLIDPSSKGSTHFFGVPLGPVDVAVHYRADGEDKTSSQKFTVDPSRPEPVPTLMMSLKGAAPPESGPSVKSSEVPKGSAEAPPTGSMIGKIALMMAIGAGAVAFLVFGLKWIYANQDKTKDALGKLGVQVPDPIAPDPAPVAPPVVAPPDPMVPIMLPGAAQEPLTAQTATYHQGWTPRLVGNAGTFELQEGVHVIGREAGLTIALTNESTLSRRHAEIVRSGNRLVLRDTGSTNGTYVNGVKVTGDQELKLGDQVQFGSAAFRLEA